MRLIQIVLIAGMLVAGPLLVGAQPSGELNQEILAQPGTDITFYGATFSMGRGSPMPMNTAFPTGVGDYSFGTPESGCGTPPPAPEGTVPSVGGAGVKATTKDCIDEFTSNELWWYTTAGFIQARSYDQVCGNTLSDDNCDYTHFHNERGQTKDIYFDTDVNPTSTLHMSADNHGWFGLFGDYGLGWNWDPGYYQDWTVATTVYHANLGEWSGDPSAKPDLTPIYNKDDAVTIVAYGESEPTDFWSLDPTIPSPTCEGECRTVHPFSPVLDWDPDFVAAGGVVPYLNDLIVRMEWYQKTDDSIYITGTPVAGYVWNLNGGEDYPNNIVLPVRNPLDVELVFPRFVHEKLVILSVLNTPWGSYDVDLESIELEIKNAAGNVVVPTPDNFQEFLDVSVAHSGHYDPINLTWIWDYQKDKLPPGDYTLTVSADNFQKSYSTSTEASFTINKDGTGGKATAGQSGILTFSDEQFESYKEGAGIGGNSGDSEPSGGSDVPESKGSPGPGVTLVFLAVGLLALARRR